MKTLKKPLIGKNVIIHSKNKTLEGLKGIIIDETKNTLKIKTTDKEKIIIKSQSTLEINGKVINGKKIQKRPEEIK